MPNIRYIFLSDMHFGASTSLLTNLKIASADTDTSQPSPVLSQLVTCLRELVAKNADESKPTLVLGGDILELALTDTNIAAMAFERFVELIKPADGNHLVGEIVYLPGNHDHHLWEDARETQYVNYISTRPPGSQLDVPWHTTKMFVEKDPKPLPCYFLTKLMQRFDHLKAKDFQINTAYPNFGLLSDDLRKAVIFTHGHFSEPIYTLMTTLRSTIFNGRKEPTMVWDIEAENFAWIDFFWSTLGRSGGVGADIGLLYDKMQDKKQLNKVLSVIGHNLVKSHSILSGLEKDAVTLLLEATVGRVATLERQVSSEPLSDKTAEGWKKYVEGALLAQLLLERDNTMPTDMTLVFGHTHKPFQKDMKFVGYPEWTSIYNSGGWVVDTEHTQPLHGGSVILVDENHSVISLNMYLENEDDDGYAVEVNEATHPGAEKSAFYERIAGLIDPMSASWREFSQIAAKEVGIRHRNLAARIEGQN